MPVRMLLHHAEVISLPLAEGSSRPASQRTVTPGLGRADRCHLHSPVLNLKRPCPAGIPGSRLGSRQRGSSVCSRIRPGCGTSSPWSLLQVCLLTEIKAGVGSAARGAAALAQPRENENKPQSFLFPPPLAFSGNAAGPGWYFYVYLLLSFWPKSMLPQIFS